MSVARLQRRDYLARSCYCASRAARPQKSFVKRSRSEASGLGTRKVVSYKYPEDHMLHAHEVYEERLHGLRPRFNAALEIAEGTLTKVGLRDPSALRCVHVDDCAHMIHECVVRPCAVGQQNEEGQACDRGRRKRLGLRG
jgi:hypothetical protein